MTIISFKLGSWRFTFTMAPVVKVVGVNSILSDGNHVLMWDFDDTKLEDVMDALIHVQAEYMLPPIYVLETKPGKNYIAYCFKKTEWRKAVEIVVSTPHVDWNFIKYSVYRGWFTLRVSEKDGRRPKLVHVIPSDVPEDCDLFDLRKWVKYETLPSWYRGKRIEINVPEGVKIK